MDGGDVGASARTLVGKPLQEGTLARLNDES